MTPVRLRRTAWMLTAFYAAFHFVMTHIPPGNLPGVAVSNYLLHFLSYGVLAGCFYLSLWLGGMAIKRAALMVLFVTSAFAVFDEILQAPVGRTPELLDWVADVSAALVAVTCFTLVRLAIRKRDEPPVAPAQGD
ncbi:MAG: VanZ family protein [Planctomycetota bacterium]|nr:VanZ family protein [Planctomycetota bacterium]